MPDESGTGERADEDVDDDVALLDRLREQVQRQDPWGARDVRRKGPLGRKPSNGKGSWGVSCQENGALGARVARRKGRKLSR